jgi:histidinol dehydrogenase
MVSPPGKEGAVSPVTLAAAGIAGVDRVFCIGGAQAIAALAYGTESVPAVNKICGPGNAFVQATKQEVSGFVGIDAIQGASEVMIIADESANPSYCAADLLAQAEHDPAASAVLVTTSRRLADKVNAEVKIQMAKLSRTDTSEAIANQGIIAVVGSMEEAVELANLYAPEHLLLLAKNGGSYIRKISNAGCIITGKKGTVVLGDYVAGPSHALPTGGTARFASPLNVGDFLKLTSVIDADKLDIEKLGLTALTIAEAEGLEAHAKAMKKRLQGN